MVYNKKRNLLNSNLISRIAQMEINSKVLEKGKEKRHLNSNSYEIKVLEKGV